MTGLARRISISNLGIECMLDVNESTIEVSQGSEISSTKPTQNRTTGMDESNSPAVDRICRMEAKDLNVYYSEVHAIKDVNLSIYENEVLSIIGPSGCGKSTFLRCLNRVNDIVEDCRVVGSIKLDGKNIYQGDLDVVELRARVGMVFQKPNPFPKSIYENVAYGPKLHRMVSNRAEADDIVYSCLEKVGLLSEVEDRLHKMGTELSGGQQQRLCIARAIAVKPDVILMDEPCSSLDPIATARVEDLIDELRLQYSIVIVTHSMQQAARVSQRTAYFHLGNLIEVGDTSQVFTSPAHKLTEDYITGKVG